MNSLNKSKLSMLIGLIFISYAGGQTILSPPYEYFFQTKNVPSGTTVIFAAVNSNSPRWDEFKNIATGTDSVTLSIFEDDNSCWDGANASGQQVPSGTYFYRLDAKAVESGERFHQTGKMILLR